MNTTAQLRKVPEVATRLAISERQVWQLLADGKLRSVKVEGSRRIPEDAIAEYLEDQQAAS